MKIISLKNAKNAIFDVAGCLEHGEIGIIPTDTLYGISGNALRDDVILRIMQIKGRDKPVSIVIHDMEWAKSIVHTSQHDRFVEVMQRFRGAFTTLWKIADPPPALPFLLFTTGLIGLRQPVDVISEVACRLGFPLTTTSVNFSGKTPMTSLHDVDPAILPLVDFIADDGPRLGPPSTIVRCDELALRVFARRH